MLKRGQKGHQDIYEKERENAKLFSEVFPKLDSLVIRMTYYQKGDNPVLMTRTLHVYPAQDPLYFYIPCLIHDCDGGRFELTPVVVSMLKASKTHAEGVLKCKGSETKDIEPDHGHIEYQVEASYKTAAMMASEQKAKDKAEKEAAARALRKKNVPERVGVRKPAVTKKVSMARGKSRAVETAKNEAAKKISRARKGADVKADVKKVVKKAAAVKKTSGKSAKKASKAGVGKGVPSGKSKARLAKKPAGKKTGSSAVKKSASASKTKSTGTSVKKASTKGTKKTAVSKTKKKTSVAKSSGAAKKRAKKTGGRK